MKLYENHDYCKEIGSFSASLDLSFLQGKTVFISGACGLVMSYFIDAILADPKQNTTIIALVYSDADRLRFPGNDPRLVFVSGDVRDPAVFEKIEGSIDYIIGAASIVDPKGYKERPIDTMLINILGTRNLLDLSVRKNAAFLLISSCEIYGDADVNLIQENYCGKLDPMDVRSGYNESKRACETLCVSYSVEKGIKTYVARLSRTFGPTQSPNDTKALSQFMKNGMLGHDVVLKSKGEQLFSFTYVQDIVGGLLAILRSGQTMNAYNVCNREVHRLKEIAKMVADIAHTRVVFDFSDDGYRASGYSKATFAIQDSSKLESLGWKANVGIRKGLESTMSIMRELYY